MEFIYIEWVDGTIMYMNINDKSIRMIDEDNPELCLFVSEPKEVIDIIIHVNDCKLMTIESNSGNEYLVWNNDTDLKVAIHSSNEYPINWETIDEELSDIFTIKGIYL